MNKRILHKEVQNFIKTNLDSDITKLILKGSPFKDVSIQELAEQIIAKNKCKKKLPAWFNTLNIYYPNKLNIEQTSSEITAGYKVKLIKGERIIDITGGFGVDCLAFAQQFKDVTHCEINTNLSQIAAHNYKQLAINNITTIVSDGIEYLKQNKQQYDSIYIDPSRRDDLKKRVFLLEDCLPNLPKHIDDLFKYSNTILVKTAPLLDIKAAINELKFVKEIHVIAIKNDVKEVLYVLENNFQGEISYKTVNLKKENSQFFNYQLSNEEASYSFPNEYLFEPNAAILKSGAFNEISTMLKIEKLHKHTHLYTFDKLIDFPGRSFKILQQIPYQAKKISKLINTNKANITIRNFPDTVAQIRKKTKLKEGGNLYLFFTTNINNHKIVLVCEKIELGCIG